MPDTPNVQPASNFIKPMTNPNVVAAGQAPGPEAQQQQVLQPTPVSPTPAAPIPTQTNEAPQVPQTPPPLAPQAPTQNPWDMFAAQQRLAELERVNREQQQQLLQMQSKAAEQNTTIDNLLKTQAEYDSLKKFNESLNVDYSNLSTVDPADAKFITDSIVNAVQVQLEPIRKRLEDQDKQMQSAINYQEQRYQQQQANQTLNKILSKHPDFMQLRNNQAYINFLNQRDGFSSQTLDQRAAVEFQLGNADYINNLLDQFKAGQLNTNSINTVAPVQTTNQAVTPAQPAQSLPTLQELNSMMQMRQITPEQYRQMLKKLREV